MAMSYERPLPVGAFGTTSVEYGDYPASVGTPLPTRGTQFQDIADIINDLRDISAGPVEDGETGEVGSLNADGLEAFQRSNKDLVEDDKPDRTESEYIDWISQYPAQAKKFIVQPGKGYDPTVGFIIPKFTEKNAQTLVEEIASNIIDNAGITDASMMVTIYNTVRDNLFMNLTVNVEAGQIDHTEPDTIFPGEFGFIYQSVMDSSSQEMLVDPYHPLRANKYRLMVEAAHAANLIDLYDAAALLASTPKEIANRLGITGSELTAALEDPKKHDESYDLYLLAWLEKLDKIFNDDMPGIIKDGMDAIAAGGTPPSLSVSFQGIVEADMKLPLSDPARRLTPIGFEPEAAIFAAAETENLEALGKGTGTAIKALVDRLSDETFDSGRAFAGDEQFKEAVIAINDEIVRDAKIFLANLAGGMSIEDKGRRLAIWIRRKFALTTGPLQEELTDPYTGMPRSAEFAPEVTSAYILDIDEKREALERAELETEAGRQAYVEDIYEATKGLNWDEITSERKTTIGRDTLGMSGEEIIEYIRGGYLEWRDEWRAETDAAFDAGAEARGDKKVAALLFRYSIDPSELLPEALRNLKQIAAYDDLASLGDDDKVVEFLAGLKQDKIQMDAARERFIAAGGTGQNWDRISKGLPEGSGVSPVGEIGPLPVRQGFPPPGDPDRDPFGVAEPPEDLVPPRQTLSEVLALQEAQTDPTRVPQPPAMEFRGRQLPGSPAFDPDQGLRDAVAREREESAFLKSIQAAAGEDVGLLGFLLSEGEQLATGFRQERSELETRLGRERAETVASFEQVPGKLEKLRAQLAAIPQGPQGLPDADRLHQPLPVDTKALKAEIAQLEANLQVSENMDAFSAFARGQAQEQVKGFTPAQFFERQRPELMREFKRFPDATRETARRKRLRAHGGRTVLRV